MIFLSYEYMDQLSNNNILMRKIVLPGLSKLITVTILIGIKISKRKGQSIVKSS